MDVARVVDAAPVFLRGDLPWRLGGSEGQSPSALSRSDHSVPLGLHACARLEIAEVADDGLRVDPRRLEQARAQPFVWRKTANEIVK